MDYFYQKPLAPLLKWPGGKTDDIKHIKKNLSYLLPKTIRNYYEPFLGGGAVWLSLSAEQMFVNDLCEEVMFFYETIRDQDCDFFELIRGMFYNWNMLTGIARDKYIKFYNSSDEDKCNVLETYRISLERTFFASEFKSKYFDVLLSSLLSKVKNIKKVETRRGILSEEDLAQNIEGALKAGFYTTVREIYNGRKQIDCLKIACFYFLREYCFSSMFRYNSKGGFNVPYGGMSYNDRSPAARMKYWNDDRLIKHLSATNFFKEDFEVFLRRTKPTNDDFIFVDPPYDSEFSTYAKNVFGQQEQKRLANYLVNECEAKFLAVMRNTDFIRGLYDGNKNGIQCLIFDKTYAVSFKNRNEKDVEHLIVARTGEKS